MATHYSRTIVFNASHKHLGLLVFIRSILLCALWASFILALVFKLIESFAAPIAWLLIAFSAIHTLTFIRLQNPLLVTQTELFVQLIIDIYCLSILFYLSGGATNPFISYLLIPICIAATTLTWRLTWIVTGLCLINYIFLLWQHIPFPIFEMGHHSSASNTNWHILGMWFNFSISAILITYFVVKMSKTLREQNELLNRLRENELRNQQLMAVTMLAAGAAHEMNTPLSTMTVLLAELQVEHKNNPALIADIDILKQQVKHCAHTLKQLVQDSSEANEGKFKQQDIKVFCESILNRWQLMRPNASYSFNLTDIKQQTITQDPRLDQAIINLLNNAADASAADVKINVHCTSTQLVWQIIDSGKGIGENLEGKLGKIMLSTKEQGLGIGLLLTHATIEYYGGTFKQTSNQPSGTITELNLPLLP